MEDYKYFQENLEVFYKEYGHCFIAIKNKKVLGTYKSFDDAFDDVSRKEELGSFIIQECVDSPSKLVQSYQFNVSLV
ncbi:MAG: hypothetical protein LBK69_05980 [Syntrophomonadaceae bacterium]|jgi:fibrillarin-like rRNA methylase|nr:hypothetical protein [Syntrophomonadaceae bacterium]